MTTKKLLHILYVAQWTVITIFVRFEIALLL